MPTLIESELFGYVKGAFTGANQTKDGLLAMAEGGTVFLDEVGELPVDLQAKMLRAIQEKEIRPVGSTRRVPINVRILAATNRDLEQAVTQGEFRRDLYFRLNVLSLRIPALRERRQDIPLLIAFFMERMVRATGQEKMLGDEALKAMLAYDWPGNVRELENCLERTYAFTSGPLIHTTDLPREVANLPLPEMADGTWRRERARQNHSYGGTGKANNFKRDHGTQWRQVAGRAAAGHRQNHALSEAQGLRFPRISGGSPILNSVPEPECRNGTCFTARSRLSTLFSVGTPWLHSCY